MRKLFTILLCCTVAGLGGYAGYRSYKVWKHKHIMTMAQDYYASGDVKSTLFSFRMALAADPRNVEAARMAADVLESSRSRESLKWRSRVVDLNPQDTEDRLALANTALTFRDYAAAADALAGVGKKGQQTAAYQNAAGAVAISLHHLAEAKEHFSEALQMAPQDPALQLNVAMVDIHGTNEQDVASARVVLQHLSSGATNSSLRCQALRELVSDAMRFKQEESALALAKELMSQTNAAFADRLLWLEVLSDTRQQEFKSTMETMERDASTNAAHLYELASWQQAHGALREGLTWLQSLGPNVRTNQPAALMIAEFQLMLKDWRGSKQGLAHQNWAGAEFMRHALLARALRGQELVDSAKTEWAQAVAAAGDERMSRTMLLNLASQWGWRNETEDLLWSFVNQYPQDRWAEQALTQMLFIGGRTQSLLKLFSYEVKVRPSDLNSKHDLSVAALLLGAKEYKPHDLAREVYEAAPSNPAFASTYAFSLLLQKQYAQALKAMEQVKPDDLENPMIAGYYGIILQANGDHEKARRYLHLSAKSLHLPEEQKLFDTALAKG